MAVVAFHHVSGHIATKKGVRVLDNLEFWIFSSDLTNLRFVGWKDFMGIVS